MKEDEELIVLVLKRHLVASLVESVYYLRLICYILEGEQGDPEYWLDPDEIANQLSEAGYPAHAGSLLAQAHSMHPYGLTFNSALNLVSYWLSRPK